MVDAARAGGRAIPELWPLGTEALALAMEVSVLEAKRLGHRAVLRLSWLLLVASVALSTLLQVAVAPPTLVGYLTAGATPVWLLGSFAVLSLLYRTPAPAADPAADAEDQAAGRRGAEQARARPPGVRRPGRRRPARHRRPPGRGRRHQRQLRPRPAGRVPGRPHPHRPGQRAAARARRWGSDDRDHLADLPQLLRQLRAARRPGPQARLLLPGLPAGRLPRPPTHQRRPAHRPPGLALRAPRAAPPARRVRAARRRPAPPAAPRAAGPAAPPAPAAATQRQRPAGPAPAAATSWRVSGASSPPCCARPPPPASPTRRPPAGRRPRPCAPSTACSSAQPTVTPPVWPAAGRGRADRNVTPASRRRAQRIVTRLAERERRIVTRPGGMSATDRHG